MPTNNFKLFDEKKANMMTDEEYAINQQRLNGVQSGIASSQLQNKTLYQTALMCYALAQLMAANGYDANDANAVSTFVNNLSLSILQKVVDKAKASDISAKTVGKWVDAAQLGGLQESISKDYLKLLGGTMKGDLILRSDPTQNLQAATKQYVDSNDKLVFLKSGRLSNGSASVGIDADMSKFLCLQIYIANTKTGSQPYGRLNIKFNNSNTYLKEIVSWSNYSIGCYDITIIQSAQNSIGIGIETIVGNNPTSPGDIYDFNFEQINNIGFVCDDSGVSFDFYIYGIKK